jgi:crotonobetainyl-CoA:carnitine CoA-transferase CaiB-like acyl-CoA transferase
MKPLEGIRVLDLTHVLAGPFCTYQLAVLGGDVIKIEPPHNPDMTREEGVVPALSEAAYGTYFQSQSAGKRAMTLDLKQQAGRDILAKLIETADVLVQNYAGEALADLGFSYEAASAINEKLIYCSLTGFGRAGPKANHPAYDVVIQAFSGLMAANGTPETGPVRVGPPMVDYGTGAQAAMAICAALLQREKTGKGQRIDVAMLDAAIMLMSAHVVDTITTGHAPGPHGNVHPRYAGYRTYDTSDGLLMVGAWTNRQLSRLFKALGENELANTVSQIPRAEVGDLAPAHSAVIAEHLKHQSADHWETLLNDQRIPAARVRTIDEAIAHEQIASRKVLQTPASPGLPGSPGAYPVAAFSYDHGSPSLDRPPPQLGEHTNDILNELGMGANQISALRSDGVV